MKPATKTETRFQDIKLQIRNLEQVTRSGVFDFSELIRLLKLELKRLGSVL